MKARMTVTLLILLLCCTSVFTFAFSAAASEDAAADDSSAIVTVTYDLNYEGAKQRITTEEITKGTVPVKQDPIRQNYDFTGWYFEPECENALGGGKALAGSGTKNGSTVTYSFTAAMGINTIVCEVDGQGQLTCTDIISPDMDNMSVLGFYKEDEITEALQEAQEWYDVNGVTAKAGETSSASAAIDEDTVLYAGWKQWDEETITMMDDCLKEVAYGVEITSRPYSYEENWFEQYSQVITPLIFLTHGGNVIPKDMAGLVDAAKELRENAVFADGVSDMDDTVWYIWGDDMAQAEDADEYDYYGFLDEEGYRPFLCYKLQPDQSNVKGNVILISGGGYYFRTNRWEAFPTSDKFYDLGYNVFVLERRVEPSLPIDSGLDLARAIRYIRYHAQDYGIGATDRIACCGFSGGGGTISQAVQYAYGDVLPTAIYPDYVCDEIDSENADMQVMIMIYSASALETDNENIPAAFVVQGKDDFLFDTAGRAAALEYYDSVGIRWEEHVFTDAAHGFGSGFGLNSQSYTDEIIQNVQVWPSLCDTFMQIVYGDITNITTVGE